MNALTVPMPVTGPAQSRPGVLVGELVGDEVDQLGLGAAAIRPSIATAPSPTGRLRVAAAAGWRPGGRPSCTGCARPRRRRTRRAAARRGRTRPASTRTRSTPRVRPVTCGRPVWSSGRRRGEEADRGERGRPAGRGAAYVGAQVVVEPDVGLVEEQQVLALDARRSAPWRSPLRLPSTPEREQRVQQEQREAGLGGHPGDAGDRDVRAAGAVEELQVDVDRLAVAAEPDRRPCAPSGRSTAPGRAPSPVARTRRRRPGAAARSTPARPGWW